MILPRVNARPDKENVLIKTSCSLKTHIVALKQRFVSAPGRVKDAYYIIVIMIHVMAV